MIRLRRALEPQLDAVHSRTWYEDAPNDAEYPYLVYNFPNDLDDGEGFCNVVLDIDGWDAPEAGDTTALENLMAAVDAAINKKTLIADDIVVTFYRNNKLSLDDDDERIKRRKYIYQARLFDLKGVE